MADFDIDFDFVLARRVSFCHPGRSVGESRDLKGGGRSVVLIADGMCDGGLEIPDQVRDECAREGAHLVRWKSEPGLAKAP